MTTPDEFLGMFKPDPNEPRFSLEKIDGSKDEYKLYEGRGMGHGMWRCTLSDFDAQGCQFRELLLRILNAKPAEAKP